MNTLSKRAAARTAGFLVLLAGLTFVSAGTLHFWQGWLSFSVSVIVITVYFLRHDPEAHCAACHGLDGSGRNQFEAEFNPPVAKLTGGVQKLSDSEIYFIIAHGIRNCDASIRKGSLAR